MTEMYPKTKFTAQDEEIIIDFVKSNEVLYNAHHKNYRDSILKNRLWLQLAQSINKDVESTTKRWKTMRDYYVRSKDKKSTGSAASSTMARRDEALRFLDQTSILKRATQTSVQTPTVDVPTSIVASTNNETDSYIDYQYLKMNMTQDNTNVVEFVVSSFSTAPTKKRKTQITDTDILREFLDKRPKPSDFMPEKKTDDIQCFCDSVGATLRKLPPLTVARLKLKIANIVGEEEIAWSEQQSTIKANTAVQVPEATENNDNEFNHCWDIDDNQN